MSWVHTEKLETNEENNQLLSQKTISDPGIYLHVEFSHPWEDNWSHELGGGDRREKQRLIKGTGEDDTDNLKLTATAELSSLLPLWGIK